MRLRIPAITDFRAKGTIMGPTGLTAVFGMGTGVTPPVWSPEKHPAGGQAAPGAGFNRWSDHAVRTIRLVVGASCFSTEWTPTAADHWPEAFGWGTGHRTSPRFGRRCPVRGEADGSGWSSDSAVGTGPLRRSPAVHSQPIDLVVFQEPSHIKCWKPRLEEGFALRCLQRLSFPDLATRRCPERDSRYTRGRSSPILSY